jgi:hypothetical protein
VKYLVLLIFFTSNCQSQNNFTVIDNQLQWQKVYDAELTKDELKESIKKKTKFEDLYLNFASRVGPFKIECDFSMPIYMRDEFTYYVTIDHKAQKYRVTVTNIRLIPSTTISLFDVTTSESSASFSGYVVKNSGELKSNRLTKKVIDCIDKKFQIDFNFKKITSDW